MILTRETGVLGGIILTGETGVLGGTILTGETGVLRGMSNPVPLCLPQTDGGMILTGETWSTQRNA